MAVKAEAGNIVLVKILTSRELEDRTGAKPSRPARINRRLGFEHKGRREPAGDPEPVTDTAGPHVDVTIARKKQRVGFEQFVEALF